MASSTEHSEFECEKTAASKQIKKLNGKFKLIQTSYYQKLYRENSKSTWKCSNIASIHIGKGLVPLSCHCVFPIRETITYTTAIINSYIAIPVNPTLTK